MPLDGGSIELVAGNRSWSGQSEQVHIQWPEFQSYLFNFSSLSRVFFNATYFTSLALHTLVHGLCGVVLVSAMNLTDLTL